MSDKAPADLGRVELGFIKRLKRQAEEQRQRATQMNSRNRRTGLLIAGLVLGICEWRRPAPLTVTRCLPSSFQTCTP